MASKCHEQESESMMKYGHFYSTMEKSSFRSGKLHKKASRTVFKMHTKLDGNLKWIAVVNPLEGYISAERELQR